jgi:hypothetical protein
MKGFVDPVNGFFQKIENALDGRVHNGYGMPNSAQTIAPMKTIRPAPLGLCGGKLNLLAKSLLAALLCIFAVTAPAASYWWIGTDGQAWGSAGN